jgi:drug/metabolite transporter superfamily protein YnfA
LKTFGIFIVALLGELGGTYAIWRWLRTDRRRFLPSPDSGAD